MPVTINPDQFRTLDYGEAIQKGQQITYNRLRNEAAGMEIEETKDMLRNRAKGNEIRQQFADMPSQIAELEKAGMFDQADKLRDTYVTTTKNEVELIGQMRAGINEENYQSVRQQMIQSGSITPELWPVEYSDKWFRDEQDKRKGNLTTLTRRWAENGAVLSQDFVQGDGNILWEGDPYQEPTKQPGYRPGSKGSEFKWTASDSNSLGRQAERLFGGTYDPKTGSLIGLDPKLASKVAAVQAEAENLYKQSAGGITHAIAMRQAARKFGIQIEDPGNPDTSNPLNLSRP